MFKKVIKNILFGIMYGEFILNIIFLIGAIAVGDDFFDFSASFYIKNMIASALVGIGFYAPTMVYSNEKLSRAMQVLIHMGIGFIIYIPLGFFAGWFPVNNGIYAVLTTIILVIIISVMIWTGFYLYYKNEAKKINNKIKQKDNQ